MQKMPPINGLYLFYIYELSTNKYETEHWIIMIATTTLSLKPETDSDTATEVQSGFYARRFWNVQSRLALHGILMYDIRAMENLFKRGRRTKY